MGLLPERLPTPGAAEWLLPRVGADVDVDRVAVLEALAADVAVVEVLGVAAAVAAAVVVV